jgi:tripartite-type tricarboxylate transporter receptor subunit TctC
VDMWYGFLAPKGTPRGIVDKLDDEFRAILALPEVKKNFSVQGMDATSSTPAEFAALMRREDSRWAEIIRKNRISAE